MTDFKQRTERAAALLIDAYHGHFQLSALPEDCVPRTPAEAYAVQDAVAAALWLGEGERIGAWKVGAPSLQATPTAAPIPPQRVHRSPARLPANGFHVIGIEAELGYYPLARDLPAAAVAPARTQLPGLIDAVHPVIEVVDTRLRDWQQADPLWKLADNQLNGALVVGDAIPAWDQVGAAEQRVAIHVNGRPVLERRGGHPLGDPLALLPWALHHAAARSDGLRAGDLIITGSWTGMTFVQPDSRVLVRFPGLGDVRVEFPL